MAGIDFSRLRRQNLFADQPVDIGSGGINMGEVDFGGTQQDFGADQNFGEGPQYQPQQSYQPGEVNLPPMEEPFGGRSPFEGDPRAPVNPSIAPPAAGPGSVGASTADDLLKIINSIYTPETTSRDRFNRLLDSAPERERPSVLSGIAAFGMGMNAKDPLDALKVHEQVMFAPHHRAMADWTAKTGPFGNAAQYENTANVNERNLAGNVATNVVNQQRYDQQNAINQQKADNERIRAQAYDFKQRHPDWEINTDGPRIYAIAPDGTGRKIDLGPSGNMSQVDLENLRGKYRVEAMAAQGQNAAGVAGINRTTYWRDGQGNLYSLNPSQAANAETMGLTPVTPGAPQFPRGPINPIDATPNAATNTPQNQRTAINNKFYEFSLTDPEMAKKWLIPPTVSTGNWSMNTPQPSGGFMGWGQSIDPKEIMEYNQVRQALGLPPMPVPQQNPGVSAAPVAKPGLGPSTAPVPQGQPGMVGGQQRYMQPPVDFSNPPSTRTGVGGVTQQIGAPTQDAQVASELAKGTRLRVTDPNTGQPVGSIPNTPQAIEAATARGLRVEVK